MTRTTLATLIGMCLSAGPAAAQSAAQDEIMKSGRRVLTAERLKAGEHVTLDGVLDEPAWQRATPAGEFIMQDPILGGQPTESTEIRVVFNKDHLYIGVINHDSEPDKLLGNTRKRDEFLSADDRFMWTMDTFLNQQTGYFFEMNPSGLMADSLMGPGGTNNREWDGIWNARVKRSDIGWVIEIDIPFRTLAFDPNAPAWGVNFQRTVRRKNEETIWTGHLRNQGLRRMSNAGLLVGLTDVTQGNGLEVKPYLAGTVGDAPGRTPAVETETTADAGGEVTYNLTPSLRAVGTVNTDFAETEVDARRVNLTRFPLQYPEKRGFFLDGATFFDFPVPAFFSRRIGLDMNGQPQRILGGAKMTGQAGRTDVGALFVSTAVDDGAPGENFLVGRVRRRILRQSYFGAIYTGRFTRDQPAIPGRHTAGVDVRLATNTFHGNSNLDFTGYYVANTAPEGKTDNASYGLRVNAPNDTWDWSAGFWEVQDVNPAVGFVGRKNYRRYVPELRYNPRPKRSRWIRRFGFGAEPNFYTDLHNKPVTTEAEIQAFRMEMHSGDTVEVQVTPTYERLEEDFEISEGIVLPKGAEYSFMRYRVQASTASKRVIAFSPQYEWGGFLSGRRQELILGVGIRPRPGVTLNINYEYNNLDLAEGSFDTKLIRFIADTQFSPFMYLVNNIQYDSVSRVVGWQSRFRWILTPGNDIFFVYTQNWVDPAGTSLGFKTLDRRAATKAVYTKRF